MGSHFWAAETHGSCDTVACHLHSPPFNPNCYFIAVYFQSLFPQGPGGSDVKASAYSAGDLGSIPGSGISPGEGNGNPLQYSCLENPMDGGIWWALVHGVTKSRTQLIDFTFTFHRLDS